MKQSQATISFIVDASTKRDFETVAADTGRSQSDLFQEMYDYYMFRVALQGVQEHGVRIAARLDLQTEDDIYAYLSRLSSPRRIPKGRAA